MFMLGYVLQCLPALRRLDVSVECQQGGTSSGRKRQRGVNVSCTPVDSVAGLLSPLTSLTALSISTKAAPESFVYKTRSPALALPSLSCITVIFKEHEWTESFVSNLIAPLTCLDISRDEMVVNDQVVHRDPEQETDPYEQSQGLVDMLTPFPGLQELRFSGTCHGNWLGQALFDMLSVRWTALMRLTALQSLCIESDQAWLGDVYPYFAQLPPSLSSLSLSLGTCASAEDPRSVPWSDVFNTRGTQSEGWKFPDILTNLSVVLHDLNQAAPALPDVGMLTTLTKLVLFAHPLLRSQDAHLRLQC